MEKKGFSCRGLFLTVLCICVLFIMTILNSQHSPLNMSEVAVESSYVRHPPAMAMFSDTGSFHRAESTPWIVIGGTTSNVSSNAVAAGPQEHHPSVQVQKTASVTSTITTLLPTSMRESQPTPITKCSPIQRIVFVKTHKTASTTMASVFERYGYYRNLTFAIGRSHVLSFQYKFSRGNLMKFPKMKGKPFDILTNHARYSRGEMDAVVPNATFITILRNPEDQVESAFGYFEMYSGMKIGHEPNPLKTFMDDPMKYYKEHKYHMWQLSRNGMLFDLGLDHKYDEDDQKINQKIRELAGEFDLVLISEYLDESLLLMKKLLCWEYMDIVYLSSGIRSKSHRYDKDRDLRDKIRQWSHGDVLLYDHFNNTLWKQIAYYGPSFQTDLKHFRDLNKSVYDECVNPSKWNKQDRREDLLTLKNNSEWCKSVIRADMGYTKMIRKSMVQRFGAPPK
ncbi:putative galactosylceramide sulfotransferase isoform X2 [Apostichopus japonicus]|uniref:Putative galactosylceramide sulfotransferase isoform X2 n=1 Tax=Stichopus japonicus TaxID=307972 RepID=A0A2G8L7F4_STIJA|nr:putative galactosylceramide sulfotransferase isoform X2 [Apostichopus japonicus]